MNPKSFTAFLLVIVGASMNAVRAVQKGKQPWSIILGGIVFGVVCVGVNDLSGKRLGTMLAAIFLLSSTLISGVAIMDSLTAVTQSYSKEK